MNMDQEEDFGEFTNYLKKKNSTYYFWSWYGIREK